MNRRSFTPDERRENMRLAHLRWAQRQANRNKGVRNADGSSATVMVRHGSDAPQHILDERDGATRGEQSITASILGDPLPGRSALDKMRAAQP